MQPTRHLSLTVSTLVAGVLLASNLFAFLPVPPRSPSHDFSGDGRSDFLWRNPNTGVTWIQNINNGQVAGGKLAGLSIGRPWEANLGDFNMDGKPTFFGETETPASYGFII